MPSAEFKRIVGELTSIGDTVIISVTKDGIKFSTSGDIGSANVTCRQSNAVDKQVGTAGKLLPSLQQRGLKTQAAAAGGGCYEVGSL